MHQKYAKSALVQYAGLVKLGSKRSFSTFCSNVRVLIDFRIILCETNHTGLTPATLRAFDSFSSVLICYYVILKSSVNRSIGEIIDAEE